MEDEKTFFCVKRAPDDYLGIIEIKYSIPKTITATGNPPTNVLVDVQSRKLRIRNGIEIKYQRIDFFSKTRHSSEVFTHGSFQVKTDSILLLPVLFSVIYNHT